MLVLILFKKVLHVVVSYVLLCISVFWTEVGIYPDYWNMIENWLLYDVANVRVTIS